MERSGVGGCAIRRNFYIPSVDWTWSGGALGFLPPPPPLVFIYFLCLAVVVGGKKEIIILVWYNITNTGASTRISPHRHNSSASGCVPECGLIIFPHCSASSFSSSSSSSSNSISHRIELIDIGSVSCKGGGRGAGDRRLKTKKADKIGRNGFEIKVERNLQRQRECESV